MGGHAPRCVRAMNSTDPSGVSRPYCLVCYAPLDRFHDARTICPRCGSINVKADQGVYWTREPKLVETEWLAKVGIVLLVAWISYLMLGGMRLSFGLGQGWAVGLPILLAAALWETASKITRHVPYFRARIVWASVVALPSLPFLYGAVFAPGSSTAKRPSLAAVGAVLLAAAWGVVLTARAFDRWRERRILSGQRHELAA